MRRAPLLLAVLLESAAIAAPGFTFGGFSADTTRFLKRGPDDRACTVAVPPVCEPADRKVTKDFAKPARTRKLGDTTLDVAVEDGAVIVRAGDKVLGRYRPLQAAVSANANVFVAGDGSAVAVEYEASGSKADVVAFPLTEAPPPPVAAPKSSPPPPTTGTAFERAVAKGGTWEQRIVPCDTAGVHLVLKKTRTFALRVDTRCQSEKNTTELSGKWTSEGADQLGLTFENEGGPTEALPCHFAACEDEATEECLACSDDDIQFTLKTVRR